MGSRLSRSRKESKKGPGSTGRKSFLHSNDSLCSQRRPSSVFCEDEPDYYSLSSIVGDPLNSKFRIRESCVACTHFMTCENERYAKHNSAIQRMLTSIPRNTKECESVDGEWIYESAPKLPDADELVCCTESRFDGLSELCLQSSSDRVDDKGTEAQALIEEEEDLGYELCPATGSLYNYGATVDPSVKITGHSAEVQRPQEPNKWKATVSEDNHTTVNQVLTNQSTDVTYMQINSSDVIYRPVGQAIDPHRYMISQTDRFDEPPESNENDCVPEAFINDNESEDSAFYQVPTQNSTNDDHYVRTGFNLNTGALVATNSHKTAKHLCVPVDHTPSYPLPRPKTQAIVVPISAPRVHGGVVLYPVQAGTKRTLSGATVEVPIALRKDLPLGCVEVGWSNNAGEFPVLALGQHPITKILHCLPHGLTFTLPVIVSVNLPVIEGQIEIFYSPTDVAQIPIWTKLRTIGAPENTHFTDSRNLVILDRDRSIARFELRHFCAFFIVENGRVIEGKKAKASVLLQNHFGPNDCSVTVHVVLGCLEDVAQQKLIEEMRIYRLEGFQMLGDIEFDLFASESKSKVKVKISKIQWMPDCDITNGDVDTEERGLHHLWNNGTVDAMFWQRSQMINGVKPRAFAATVHVQQDDRQDIRKKIFCHLESPLPVNEQQHMPVNDYGINQPCNKRVKDFPTSDVSFVPPPCSCCSSEWMDLRSDRPQPEIKAAVPVETLNWQQKEIETRQAVKL